MFADAVLQPLFDHAAARAGVEEVHDVHVHVGVNDPAGHHGTEEEAQAALDRLGPGTVAWVFPLREPGGYRESNERMCRWAAESEGRRRAIARVDPAYDAAAELERCLAMGAIGPKLHPRSEGFEVDDPRLGRMWAIADEQRLPVMVHAGSGVPGLGRKVLRIAEAHPGARIILAHCAVSELAWLWRELPDHPNVLLDLSWWNPLDVLATFALVDPGRLLYATDIPFASPVQNAAQALRCGLQAGLTEEQLRGVMGGQAARLADGGELLDLGRAPGPGPAVGPLHERLAGTILTVCEPLLRGLDGGEALKMAKDATRVAEGTEEEPLFAAVRELLERGEAYDVVDELRPGRTPGFDVVLLAGVVARTPLAGVPEL